MRLVQTAHSAFREELIRSVRARDALDEKRQCWFEGRIAARPRLQQRQALR